MHLDQELDKHERNQAARTVWASKPTLREEPAAGLDVRTKYLFEAAALLNRLRQPGADRGLLSAVPSTASAGAVTPGST